MFKKKEQVINKEVVGLSNEDTAIFQAVCTHPLWFQYEQYKVDDDIIAYVKCVVCGKQAEKHFNEFVYTYNEKTGRYETNIIRKEDISKDRNIDQDALFNVVQIEFERFARDYELKNQNGSKDTPKIFIKEYKSK